MKNKKLITLLCAGMLSNFTFANGPLTVAAFNELQGKSSHTLGLLVLKEALTVSEYDDATAASFLRAGAHNPMMHAHDILQLSGFAPDQTRAITAGMIALHGQPKEQTDFVAAVRDRNNARITEILKGKISHLRAPGVDADQFMARIGNSSYASDEEKALTHQMAMNLAGAAVQGGGNTGVASAIAALNYYNTYALADVGSWQVGRIAGTALTTGVVLSAIVILSLQFGPEKIRNYHPADHSAEVNTFLTCLFNRLNNTGILDLNSEAEFCGANVGQSNPVFALNSTLADRLLNATLTQITAYQNAESAFQTAITQASVVNQTLAAFQSVGFNCSATQVRTALAEIAGNATAGLAIAQSVLTKLLKISTAS